MIMSSKYQRIHVVCRRPAAEAVPHRGVRAQAVLRDVAVQRLRPPVGREGLRQPPPAGPHAEHAARDHLPGDTRTPAALQNDSIPTYINICDITPVFPKRVSRVYETLYVSFDNTFSNFS